MASTGFIRLCFAKAEEAGLVTQKMTTEEVVEWYKENYSYSSQENKAMTTAKKVNKKQNQKKQVKNIIKKLNEYKDKPIGTYNYHTGEPVNLSDGYMVTFH